MDSAVDKVANEWGKQIGIENSEAVDNDMSTEGSCSLLASVPASILRFCFVGAPD